MTAAPELLEALLTLKKAYDDGNLDMPTQEYDTIVNAINKATQ